MLTFEQLKAHGLLVLTNDLCTHCKEAKRGNKYLIQLPNLTRKLSLTARVCPHCDGESLVEKAYRSINEQKDRNIPQVPEA